MAKREGDLNNRPLIELNEILERQKKLLSNKTFINRLPDKGEKIRSYYDKVLNKIEEQHQIDESCKIFSQLTLDSNQTFIPTQSNVENFEWKTKSKNFNENHCLDSDDDSEPDEPLRVLAGSRDLKKKIVYLKEEKKLITEADLKDIEEFKADSVFGITDTNVDGHTKYICKKTEKGNLDIKHSYKPYKTLITDVNDPSKELSFKRGKHWEVTAATPPPSIHGSVKEISIQQSLKLHETQSKEFKEIQIKHAADKLTSKIHGSVGKTPVSVLSSKDYRDTRAESDSDDSQHGEASDQEVYDDEAKEGGVTFTIYE